MVYHTCRVRNSEQYVVKKMEYEGQKCCDTVRNGVRYDIRGGKWCKRGENSVSNGVRGG